MLTPTVKANQPCWLHQKLTVMANQSCWLQQSKLTSHADSITSWQSGLTIFFFFFFFFFFFSFLFAVLLKNCCYANSFFFFHFLLYFIFSTTHHGCKSLPIAYKWKQCLRAYERAAAEEVRARGGFYQPAHHSIFKKCHSSSFLDWMTNILNYNTPTRCLIWIFAPKMVKIAPDIFCYFLARKFKILK